MADVFVSYARPERDRIQHLAAVLEAAGHTVWWDRHIEGGARYASDIERELDQARVVIVAWSDAARQSDWVSDEAAAARDQGKLIPVSLDGQASPLGFRQYQSIDLSSWDGRADSDEMAELLRVVSGRLEAEQTASSMRSSTAAAPRPVRKPGVRFAALGILVVFVLAAAFWFFRGPRVGEQADTASIAVLPFADLSQNGDQAYFANGIAEEILHLLARAPELRVAGRTSSFQFTSQDEDLNAIGQRLNVAHVLSGSVRKQANRVRITARLVKVRDGFSLWSETFDREFDDIFAIQDEIAQSVARALPLKLGARMEQRSAAQIGDPAAHDVYLRARERFATRNTPSMREAVELFDAAIVLDPNYAAAHAGRGRTLSALLYFDSRADVPQLMAEAEASARKALALDPENSEAHATLAQIHWFYDWDWAAAHEAMTRAIELAPNDAEMANFAGDHFRHRAEYDRAGVLEDRAIELNPLHAINYADRGYVYLQTGQCAKSLSLGRQAVALDPMINNAVGVLGLAQMCLGLYDEAAESVAAIHGLGPEGVLMALELSGGIALGQGDLQGLKRVIDQMMQLANDGAQAHYFIAKFQVRLGDLDAAAQSLEKAYLDRDVMFILDFERTIAEHWPDHPGIQAALRKPELASLFAIRRAAGVSPVKIALYPGDPETP